MNHLNPNKTGMAVGKLLAGVHLVWAVLVALGWAQSIIAFSMWAHMVKGPAVTLAPFNISAAIALVIMAWVVGYAVGYVFAKISNWFHR